MIRPLVLAVPLVLLPGFALPEVPVRAGAPGGVPLRSLTGTTTPAASGTGNSLANAAIDLPATFLAPSGLTAYDQLATVVRLDPGQGVSQVSALAGYVLNDAPFDVGNNRGAGVALWGQSIANVDGAKAWGMALHVHDGTGPGDGTGRLVINEIDVGVNHANTEALGLSMTAGFSVQPAVADGFLTGSFNPATRWLNGFRTGAGSARTAFRAGPGAGGGAVGSQPIVWESRGAGGTGHEVRLEASPDGDAVVTAPALAVVSPTGQPVFKALPGGLATGAAGHAVAHAGNLGPGLSFDAATGRFSGTLLGAPASSSAPCAPGATRTDAAFLYVCVAADTWRRAALQAF